MQLHRQDCKTWMNVWDGRTDAQNRGGWSSPCGQTQGLRTLPSQVAEKRALVDSPDFPLCFLSIKTYNIITSQLIFKNMIWKCLHHHEQERYGKVWLPGSWNMWVAGTAHGQPWSPFYFVDNANLTVWPKLFFVSFLVCRILVPQPGTEPPGSLQWKHGVLTTRELPWPQH